MREKNRSAVIVAKMDLEFIDVTFRWGKPPAVGADRVSLVSVAVRAAAFEPFNEEIENVVVDKEGLVTDAVPDSHVPGAV